MNAQIKQPAVKSCCCRVHIAKNNTGVQPITRLFIFLFGKRTQNPPHARAVVGTKRHAQQTPEQEIYGVCGLDLSRYDAEKTAQREENDPTKP